LFGGSVLQDRLLALLKDVWNEGRVVDTWRGALIVLVPKKGNLQSCDNWRGISLMLWGKFLQELSTTVCR